jgi:hypothetical protein
MPIIDRWLDQSPEKYFILASTLLSSGPIEADNERVLREWIAALEELENSTSERISDGGPIVAIEGPRRLSKYLRTGNGLRKAECEKLADKLDEIAFQGERYSKGDHAELHEGWARRLAVLLKEAIAQSRRRLPT